MNPAVLSIDRLNFGYPERRLFVDWSIAVAPGVTWVHGGDGSGKSTLLKLIAGELQGHGSFTVDGIRVDANHGARERRVAWCDPKTEDFDSFTALAYFDRLRGDWPAFDGAQLRQHLVGFALEPHLGKPLYQLSTGSKRKVWLAGSLASGAPVTLLDQPQAALDEPSTRHLMHALGLCAAHPSRAWIVADHELPEGLALAGVIELPG